MGAQEDIVSDWIQETKEEMKHMRYLLANLKELYEKENEERMRLAQIVEQQRDQIFEMDKELHPCPPGYYKYETGGYCVPDPNYKPPTKEGPTPQP